MWGLLVSEQESVCGKRMRWCLVQERGRLSEGEGWCNCNKCAGDAA